MAATSARPALLNKQQHSRRTSIAKLVMHSGAAVERGLGCSPEQFIESLEFQLEQSDRQQLQSSNPKQLKHFK